MAISVMLSQLMEGKWYGRLAIFWWIPLSFPFRWDFLYPLEECPKISLFVRSLTLYLDYERNAPYAAAYGNLFWALLHIRYSKFTKLEDDRMYGGICF